MPTPPALEFWFDFASNYSYLSAMRIEREATDRGVAVVWKPFLLGPIFQQLGWSSSPFVLQKRKGEYVWRDMARLCAKYGLTAWRVPSEFPRASLLPARVAVAARGEAWLPEFCRRVFVRNFVDDQDIHTPEATCEVLAALGQPADAWLQRAQRDDTKALLRAQTDEAQARGLFGAPSFFVGDELFWGNDRLDDALAWAATTSG
jgi:2-hydroxychromene-2-carboxylate isomerase